MNGYDQQLKAGVLVGVLVFEVLKICLQFLGVDPMQEEQADVDRLEGRSRAAVF